MNLNKIRILSVVALFLMSLFLLMGACPLAEHCDEDESPDCSKDSLQHDEDACNAEPMCITPASSVIRDYVTGEETDVVGFDQCQEARDEGYTINCVGYPASSCVTSGTKCLPDTSVADPKSIDYCMPKTQTGCGSGCIMVQCCGVYHCDFNAGIGG